MVWFCGVGAMLAGFVSMSPLGGCCWFILPPGFAIWMGFLIVGSVLPGGERVWCCICCVGYVFQGVWV